MDWLIGARSTTLHVGYCENGDRCNDYVNANRIGNHSCTSDYNHELRVWMPLHCRRSMPFTDFSSKYLKYGERDKVELRGHIANHQQAFRWPVTGTRPTSRDKNQDQDQCYKTKTKTKLIARNIFPQMSSSISSRASLDFKCNVYCI